MGWSCILVMDTISVEAELQGFTQEHVGYDSWQVVGWNRMKPETYEACNIKSWHHLYASMSLAIFMCLNWNWVLQHPADMVVLSVLPVCPSSHALISLTGSLASNQSSPQENLKFTFKARFVYGLIMRHLIVHRRFLLYNTNSSTLICELLENRKFAANCNSARYGTSGVNRC